MFSSEPICQLWKSASEAEILNHWSVSLLERGKIQKKRQQVGNPKKRHIVRNIQLVEKSRHFLQHLMFFPRTNHTADFLLNAPKANNIAYGQSVTDHRFLENTKP